MSELYNGNITDKMWVTPRSYELVAKSLGLDMENLKSGTKILSIGEGRSDFASVINKKFEEKNITAVALDPIYSIANPKLSEEKFVDSIKSSGLSVKVGMPEHLASNTSFANLQDSYKNRLDVAGTIYQLPFAAESFDLIVLPSVFEYVDLNKAMPELLHVLKKNGEVRINRTQFSIIIENEDHFDEFVEEENVEEVEKRDVEKRIKFYLTGLVEEDRGYIRTLKQHPKSPDIGVAVQHLAQEGLQMYALVTDYWVFDHSSPYVSAADGGGRKEDGLKELVLQSDLAIFKKDVFLPEISKNIEIKDVNLKELGKLVQVDISKIYTDHRGVFCYANFV